MEIQWRRNRPWLRPLNANLNLNPNINNSKDQICARPEVQKCRTAEKWQNIKRIVQVCGLKFNSSSLKKFWTPPFFFRVVPSFSDTLKFYVFLLPSFCMHFVLCFFLTCYFWLSRSSVDRYSSSGILCHSEYSFRLSEKRAASSGTNSLREILYNKSDF